MPNYLDLIDNKQIKLSESKNMRGKLYTFTPVPLKNITINMDEELIKLLIECHKVLGEVKGLTKYIDADGFFVNLIRINDSISSCRIDRIYVDFIRFISKKKPADGLTHEKVNTCIKATSSLRVNSFSKKFLCNLHSFVMANDEIEYWIKQQPDFIGNIRSVQSSLFLGEGLSVINEFRYNPTPPEELESLLGEMFDYYIKNTKHDILIKLALIHYQFESLHPFLGGNGRIGRLIIPQILIENRLIDHYVLPFSEYLAINKIEYFDRLWDAQLSKNVNKWVKYFLNSLIISANLTKRRMDKYVICKNQETELINSNENYRTKLIQLYNKIIQEYIIDVKTAAETLHVSYNTANKLIEVLCGYKILKPLNNQKRYKVYIYSAVDELLN